MPTVVIEYMPRAHRESHRQAGNSGSWPANGSQRVSVVGTWYGDLDPNWSSIVADADPAAYPLLSGDDHDAWNDILAEDDS